MAAACRTDSAGASKDAISSEVVIKTEPVWDKETSTDPEDVPQLQEPVVALLSPVCGLQSLVWSQDHRLAVSTTNALCVIELRCDFRYPKQQLCLHRTSVSLPQDEHRLQVGPPNQVEAAYEKFSSHPDPAIKQFYLVNSVLNPKLQLPKGIKYTSWSPLGCDSRGRCLLACLTLDHRLSIFLSHNNLDWDMQMDLSKTYGETLKQNGYANKDNEAPKVGLLNFDELQRRYLMQTPVRMEWSSLYKTKRVLPSNVCEDAEMVLLAVLMENGDLVVWRFMVPFTREEDAEFYSIIESGVDRPSGLAWWEYESGSRRMSGLIVGSQVGPIKIVPVNLTGIKGYFTLRHPVALWKENDQIAVKNIKCIPMIHPKDKANCSLIVASRGCYVFWCLLMISNTGLNIHNSHIAGLHSLPIVSVVVSQRPVVVLTCSLDGWIKRLTPTFTEKGLHFEIEDMIQPEKLTGRRMHGLALSQNGAYLAIASTQGLVDRFHPLQRKYQVHFMALRSSRTAEKILMNSSLQNLFKVADLLDIVRMQILKMKQIPVSLQHDVDRRIQVEDCTYLWKFKLFLVRTLYQSLQKPNLGPLMKPKVKALISDVEVTGGDKDKAAEEESAERTYQQEKEEDSEEQVSEVQAWINLVETHLMRENIKKVLGAVYLNPLITHNTSVPTCGLLQFLSAEQDDRDAQVLIGHVKTKLNKQTFQERCSLCEEVLPFTDCKQTTCANGHMWQRCGLSYQACQALTFRRCLLLDSISRLPEPEDPAWIQKMLQAPCALCDSPMI